MADAADEASYEYACMRAELLGLDKPDRETFMKELQEKKALLETEEELEIQRLKELENQGDELKNISGGLDELNSILTVTQKKINKFKNVCGSLTSLLKIKVGHGDSTESIDKSSEVTKQESESENTNNDQTTAQPGVEKSEETEHTEPKKESVPPIKKDLGKAIDSQVDKLDSLLMKAENAQYSMQYQNKQMKTFLKK